MEKISLAIGAGGSYGAYALGAVKCLQDKGLSDRLEISAGNSVGSLISLALATGNIDRMIQIFSDKKSMDSVIRYRRWWNILDWYQLWFEGSAARSGLENLMKKNIDKTKPFNDVRVIAGAVTIASGRNLRKYWDSKEETTETMFDAVRASCAIPLLFRPVKIGSYYYCDAFYVEKTPLRVVLDTAEASNKVIVISNYSTGLQEDGRIRDPLKESTLDEVAYYVVSSWMDDVIDDDYRMVPNLITDTKDKYVSKSGKEIDVYLVSNFETDPKYEISSPLEWDNIKMMKAIDSGYDKMSESLKSWKLI
jgi:NTE family protein